MGNSEIVQALVSPIEKLIAAVSGTIGKVYEPRHIRKMADAKAYELKTISDVVRNNSDVPIVYDSTGVSIDTSDFEDIAKRASRRLAFQEITKQQNIEAVVDNAYQELESARPISDESVDYDWMFRFFNCVENVSNDDMRKIWGHILAGEIQSPSKYSFRTLEKMRNITRNEAQLFQRIAAISLQYNNTTFILADNSLLDQQGLYFVNLLTLEECGIMSSQGLSLTLTVSNTKHEIIRNSKVLGKIVGKSEKEEEIKLSIFVFTKAGSELIDAIQPEQNDAYIKNCMEFIRHQHEERVFVTAHHISNVTDEGGIRYVTTDILSDVQIES